MAAPVSDDPQKAQAAALLKRLLKERGYTHQSFADEIEVSPGLVSQWATNRGGVPAERAVAVASLLGVAPEEISINWRTLRGQFLASQSLGLDAITIGSAITLAKKAFRLGAGEELVIERDPEAFAQALRTAIAMRMRLEEADVVRSGSGDGQAGAIGRSARTKKAG